MYNFYLVPSRGCFCHMWEARSSIEIRKSLIESQNKKLLLGKMSFRIMSRHQSVFSRRQRKRETIGFRESEKNPRNLRSSIFEPKNKLLFFRVSVRNRSSSLSADPHLKLKSPGLPHGLTQIDLIGGSKKFHIFKASSEPR